MSDTGSVKITDGEIYLEDSVSDNTIKINKTGALFGSYENQGYVTEIKQGKIFLHQDIASLGTYTTTIDEMGVYNNYNIILWTLF